jgi:hypothetical protein
MAKKIKLVEMGYFHPSQANWSYHIFMIIDKTGARLYKATFGGESRIKLKNLIIDRLSIGAGSDTVYKGRVVAKMPDIEYYNGYNWGDKSNPKP